MTTPKFNPRIADRIMHVCEVDALDNETAAIHLAACLSAVTPTRKHAHYAVDYAFDQLAAVAKATQPD